MTSRSRCRSTDRFPLASNNNQLLLVRLNRIPRREKQPTRVRIVTFFHHKFNPIASVTACTLLFLQCFFSPSSHRFARLSRTSVTARALQSNPISVNYESDFCLLFIFPSLRSNYFRPSWRFAYSSPVKKPCA